MQDNFDKAWKDKLGGYQAPADPQDWAAMSAMLDAKEDKRAGFFWWGLLGLAMLVTVGGISYRYLLPLGTGNNATEIAGDNHTPDTNSAAPSSEGHNGNSPDGSNGNHNSAGAEGLATTDGNNVDDSNTNTIDADAGKPSNGTNGNTSTQTDNPNNPKLGNTANSNATNPSTKSNKKGNNKKKANTPTNNASGNETTGNPAVNGSTTKSRNNKHNTTAWNVPATNTTQDDAIAAGGDNNGYYAPNTSITLKQIRKLPNSSSFAFSKDTSDIKLSFFAKPSIVSHHLGFSSGISASAVDRSSNNNSGFNVGLQYTMMIKNRVGLHAGIAYRLYSYFTDLVVCNYDLYQCPNNYSSTLKTIDLHAGLQVNLVKSDKVEWYVMGGISNQFMLTEKFEYNLPPVDTANPTPIEPPRNTSFTGGGVSGYEESITMSDQFNSTSSTSLDPQMEGKFLRERYLGAWYLGTGVTWNLTHRMNLQLEPVFGRSFQFVGIQDKKLWSTSVNVRFNVKLGR